MNRQRIKAGIGLVALTVAMAACLELINSDLFHVVAIIQVSVASGFAIGMNIPWVTEAKADKPNV